MSIHVGGKQVPSNSSPGAVTSPGLHITQSSTSLLAEAPALCRADWIPEGAFAELDELRAEHQKLRNQSLAVDRELQAIKQRFDAEDSSNTTALRAKVSDPSVELPDLTPPEERAAAIGPLEDRKRAVAQVQDDFLRRAVAAITEKYPEWIAILDSQDGEIEDRIEEARAALANAERERGATVQLRVWLERTAGQHPRFRDLDGRHIAYPDLAGAGKTAAPAGIPGSESESESESGPVAVSPTGRAQQLAERANRFNLNGGDSDA